MALPDKPITRKEKYLSNIAGQGTALPEKPLTREEQYLDIIAKEGGPSGEGDMKKSVYDNDLGVANAGGIAAYVDSAVGDKVDKVEGKGLSTNDYTDEDATIVAGVTTALEGKQDTLTIGNDGYIDL